jgi:Mrp family chromosome partitioning ATPase
MSELRARFSFVIVDTTPISAVADFKLIQQLSDGVVLVLRPDHSNRAMGLKAASLIPREKLLGTVINDFKEWAFWKNRDHYEYYSAGAGKNKPANK